jgi:cytochrome c peroxidase
MVARRHRLASLLLGLLVVEGCEPQPDVVEYDWSLPDGVAPPTTPPDNPQTPEKVELGRHLFYDLRLSKNQNRACGTCHEQKKAFTDGFHRAVGTDNDLHGHNTMTLTNAGYRRELGWTDMSVRTLEQQLLVPLLGDDPVEMGMGGSEAQLLAFLASDDDYAELFAAAFPDAAEPVTLDNLARSIAAFERTILSVDAPLDRYLRGDDAAISDAAKRGWELFRSPEVGCDRCHGGPDFASPTEGDGMRLFRAGVAAVRNAISV